MQLFNDLDGFSILKDIIKKMEDGMWEGSTVGLAPR
jgi:hypothetical protein